MFYIQLFGDAFDGDEKSFDLAATRFDSLDDAIQGTTALATERLFPFDKAEGFRVLDASHATVHEAHFAAA